MVELTPESTSISSLGPVVVMVLPLVIFPAFWSTLFPIAWLTSFPAVWLTSFPVVWLVLFSVVWLAVLAGAGLAVLPVSTGLAFLTGISFPL